jgi:hypothetical protein
METVFTTAEGTTLDTQLGFLARTVVIDNYSQSWAFCPAAGRYVPPYTHGFTVSIAGTNSAIVYWQTPTTFTAAAFGSGQLITTWTDADLPNSSGISVFQPGAGQQVVGSWSVPSGNPQVSATSPAFTLPPGANGVVLTATSGSITEYNSAGLPQSQIIAQGTNTLVTYGIWNLFGSSNNGTFPIYFAAFPSLDSTISFTLSNAVVAANTVVEVSAILNPTLVTILNNTQNPVPIYVPDLVGNQQNVLNVIARLAFTNKSNVYTFQNTITAGSTVNVSTTVPGSNGIAGLYFSFDSAVLSTLQVIFDGTTIALVSSNTTALNAITYNPAITSSAGNKTVSLKNAGSNDFTVTGTMLVASSLVA